MADNAPAALSPTHDIQHCFAYDDLRGWLAEAERLGDLEIVTGASWGRDICLAATVTK